MSKITLRSYPSDIDKLFVREAIEKYGIETVVNYVNRKSVPENIKKQFKTLYGRSLISTGVRISHTPHY